MIISNELWRKYKNLKQEVLNLKQIKKASCASKYYRFEASAPQSSILKITYKSGTQPIISEALTDASVAFSTPSGNTQYLSTFTQYASKIVIFSTREIEKVEDA